MSKITAHSENAWKVRCFETLKCFLPTWQLTSLHCTHYETIHCSRLVTSPLVHPKFHLPFSCTRYPSCSSWNILLQMHMQSQEHGLLATVVLAYWEIQVVLIHCTCRWSAGNTCQIWSSMSRSLIQQHSSLPTILDTLVEKNATSWSSMYTCVKMCA